jgi:hypothetical protein
METILMLIAIVLLLIVIAGMLLFAVTASLDLIGYVVSDVPFIPIPHYVVEKVVALAPKKNGVFYDLGSGEGRMVVAVARAYPEMQVIGIEKAPLPVLMTRFFRKNRPANAEFMFKDFNEVSLSNASFVYIYLLSKISFRLEPKLVAELPRGARLVSCDFPLKIRQPDQIIPVAYKDNSHTLYVYDF